MLLYFGMKISYQGVPGSYSHKALLQKHPKAQAVNAKSFEEAIELLTSEKVQKAFLPINNSEAGRVYGIHNLIYKNNLFIESEFFLPVKHCLIAPNGVKTEDLNKVFSHPQALAQCSEFIKENGLKEVVWSDTAESVKHLVESGAKHSAAIASDLSAKIYGAKILKKNIMNDKENTTRFVTLSLKKPFCKMKEGVITSIFYITKNIPAALYKSLSGFATEGINLLSIESFVPMKRNGKAMFYLEFEGYPESDKARRALEELEFYSSELRVLGTYREEKHR